MHCCIPRLQCRDAANTKAPDLYTALIATAKRFEKVIDPSNRPRELPRLTVRSTHASKHQSSDPVLFQKEVNFTKIPKSPPKLWGGWMAKNNFFRETLVAFTSPFTITTGDTETRALKPTTVGFHQQRRSVISPPGSQFIRAGKPWLSIHSSQTRFNHES